MTVHPERLIGVYKHLRHGVVALVFLCRPVDRQPAPTAEFAAVEYVDPVTVADRAGKRILPRTLDALRTETRVAIRSTSVP